jgi:hypothetical protein
MMLRVRPHFHPVLTPDAGEVKWPSLLESPYVRNLHTRLQEFTGSPGLSQDIVRIWARLHQLSSFLAKTPFTKTETLDECLLSDKLDAIERQTMDVFHSKALGQSRNPALLITFLNAACIYIIQELREVPKGSSACTIVAGRIHSGFELVNLKPLAIICPDVLLWTIMVGMAGAPSMGPTRAWFLNTLERLSDMLRITVPSSLSGLDYFEAARRTIVADREKAIPER